MHYGRERQFALLTGLVHALFNRSHFPDCHFEKLRHIAIRFLQDSRTKRPCMRIPSFAAFEANHQLLLNMFMNEGKGPSMDINFATVEACVELNLKRPYGSK